MGRKFFSTLISLVCAVVITHGKCIFITGATGFVGKATLEKLLRACREVEAIYVLIRQKHNDNVQARLESLLENSLFGTLKKNDSKALKKIVGINGDISLPNLGLSVEDQQTLEENVSVVIHAAATINLDATLKHSLNVNFQGTQRIVELCKRMIKLVALVHVSTAFSNCEREEIDEVIYPPPTDPIKLISYLECVDDVLMEQITPHLIGAKPNTYTFTKALAEHILTVEAQNLPVCIVRPSIVTATWKEPVPGWVDNMNGLSGPMIAIGKGMLRSLICHRKNVGDLIPLDFPVNLILTAAWYTARHSEENPGRILVYNCCSGAKNPLLWGKYEKWIYKSMITNPFSGVLWYPTISFRTNKNWHKIKDFVIHFVPAYIIDTITSSTGGKPMMLKIYRKLNKALEVLEYFGANQWRFKTGNAEALYEKMSSEDQRLFGFNVREIEWESYLRSYCLGLRKYTMKEDDSTMKAARYHVRKLCWVHSITIVCLLLVLWKIIMIMFGFETGWLNF